ncbi:MAG: DUF4058 family protein [Thermoguttaceae bacterium]
MSIHDWTRVDAGIFHHFHQAWTIEIAHALNGGGLPPGYFAMAEQITSGLVPDVVTLKRRATGSELSPEGESSREDDLSHLAGGVAVADAPPSARFVTSAESDLYAGKANRIVIEHRLGQVVAVLEVVSPGNKSSRHALRSFVDKAEELFRNGINLLVVDLFPPSPRDPQGIHKAIWDEICEGPFELPPDKPLTVAAYSAGEPKKAFVEPVAVGAPLPSLPIFLNPRRYVPAPLEMTYQATWGKCPDALKEAMDRPVA